MISASQIFSQAMEHVPALLLVWLTIYSLYWIVGIANWPACARRDQLVDNWGSIEHGSIESFHFRSLALISAISLFLELLVIRWITSEIRVFAYFKSLVLIACFLGFGLGCYLTRKKIRVSYTLAPLLGLAWLTELSWDPVRRLMVNLSGFIGWFSDVHVWNRAYFKGNFLWGALSAGVTMSIVIPLFGLIAICFVPMGQLVGRYLENSREGVLAYSTNIIGSVVGIWLYTALCFFSTPPVVWFAVLWLGLLSYFWSFLTLRKTLCLSFAVLILLFAIGTQKRQWWGEEGWKGAPAELHGLEPGKTKTLWSPYQKLTWIPLKKGNEIVRYILTTNDTWYQQILDLSAAAVARNPELYDEGISVQHYQYNLPYEFYRNPPKVLIAGAGMGNDAAAALRHGAGSVTAVEIDPLIYAEGRQLHFESPYSSDRVEVHIDDARSFIQNTREKFDLVVFSILDSHTLSSSYTNIRLDNYVYTAEGMTAARKLVKPDGLFVMSFSSERPWFTKRLHDVVTRAFEKEPLMITENVSFFVVGPGNRVEAALAADPELKQFVASHRTKRLEEAELTTDDWPYLYQQHRGIPVVVWVLSIGLVAICWLTFKKLKPPTEGVEWHFFFLGGAFMLLEVQIISKLALLFGTTWLVNSIVITTLLMFILLSNWLVWLFPRFPRKLAYAGLFGTLAVGFLIPTNGLFYESLLVRGAVASVLYCSPVFFSGLIFISSFKEVGFRAQAFGSNLLGALVGGLLDSLSYLIGIKALVLLAGFLYLLSIMAAVRIPSEMSRMTEPAGGFSS